MFNTKKFCFLMAALYGVFVTLCGKEIFVSPDGSDRDPGSKDKPLAIIEAAAKRAVSGDTVRIGPGIYREQNSFPKIGKTGQVHYLFRQPVRCRRTEICRIFSVCTGKPDSF